MAELDAGDLAYLHSELGSTIDEADLQARYDRLGSVQAVALEVTRQRLADLLNTPGRLSDEGSTIDQTANITALQKQLQRILAEVPDDSGEVTGGLVTQRLVGRRLR